VATKRTISVRAPKKIMEEMRLKFPELTDSAIIGLGLKTSALNLEGALRKKVSREDRERIKKVRY